jgi:hypothetical protein
LKALFLVGVPEQLRRQGTIANVDAGTTTVDAAVPNQIDLRFAALGSDKTQQQAILSVQHTDYFFAAVVNPKGNGWERIAQFACWCKYGEQFPEDFMQTRWGIDGYELIMHASSGGTGVYTQDEVHFRLYRGEMKPVLSFSSRHQEVHFDDTHQTESENRRFSLNANQKTGVLIEDRSGVSRCQDYTWSDDAFRYSPVGNPRPCAPVK